MDKKSDVVIVGAGPAGLAAACAARSCGLDVTLVDEQAAPGGQLFRNIHTPSAQRLLESKEREQGLSLVESFSKSGAIYYPLTTVWGLEPNKVYCTIKGKAEVLSGNALILAPGAMERPVPFPGWTLPGVMGAGGADILLRSGGTLPKGPIILAGNGPLLLLLASHLLEAGVSLAAWLDTGNWFQRLFSAALMPASLLDVGYMGKGMKIAMKSLRGKIPFVTRVTSLVAEGNEQLERIRYIANGKEYKLAATTLLRHEGIIPRTHMLSSIGAHHQWDAVQRYWYPVCSEDGETSIPNVFLAGDASFVHGGDASQLKGTLAGIAVARKLGVITADEARYRSTSARKNLRRMQKGRFFLKHLFAPAPELYAVPDRTVICRCECVTAGAIRKAVTAGAHEVNEVKRMTRCGMGKCQGRMCGPALAELTAASIGATPADVGRLNIQQPFRPVTLEQYCNLYAPEPMV